MPVLVLIGKRRDSGKDIFANRIARRLRRPIIVRFSAPLKGASFFNGNVDAFTPKLNDDSRSELIRLGTRCLDNLGRGLYASQAIQSFLHASSGDRHASMIVPDWRYTEEYYELVTHLHRSFWDTVVLVLLRPASVNGTHQFIDNNESENEYSVLQLIRRIQSSSEVTPRHIVSVVDTDYSSQSKIRESSDAINMEIDRIVSQLSPEFTIGSYRKISVYLVRPELLDDLTPREQALCNTESAIRLLESYGFEVVNDVILQYCCSLDASSCNGSQRSRWTLLNDLHSRLSKSQVVFVDFRGVNRICGIPEEMLIGKMQNKTVVTVIDGPPPRFAVSARNYIHRYSDFVTDKPLKAIEYIRDLLSCEVRGVEVLNDIEDRRERLGYGIQVGS